MNVNLMSVMHVLDGIPTISITFEKPEGRGVCIIRHRLQQVEEVICVHQNRLFEVSDFKWLGVEELDEEVLLEQYQMKASKVRANYVVGGRYTRYRRGDSDVSKRNGVRLAY